MTPFEIRLELVKLAKDMLNDDFHTRRGLVEMEWNNQVALAMDRKQELPSTPEYPKFFTEDDVIAKASRLNDFISTGKV